MIISHIGQLSFLSLFHNKALYLKNVLCVWQISKNLLNISIITKDNNVSIEFSIDQCVIHDKLGQTFLLKGKLRDGLHQLSVTKLFDHCVLPEHIDVLTAPTSIFHKPSYASKSTTIITPLNTIYFNGCNKLLTNKFQLDCSKNFANLLLIITIMLIKFVMLLILLMLPIVMVLILIKVYIMLVTILCLNVIICLSILYDTLD